MNFEMQVKTVACLINALNTSKETKSRGVLNSITHGFLKHLI